VKVPLQLLADFKSVLGRYSQVSAIEQSVEIGAKQETITDCVRAIFGEWLDVCRLQRWQGMFMRYRARPLICFRHRHSKGALAAPRYDQSRCAVSSGDYLFCRHVAGQIWSDTRCSFLAFAPNSQPLALRKIVGLVP